MSVDRVPLFSKYAWRHIQVLLAGAILTPGKRNIGSALRYGFGHMRQPHRCHRVLNWLARSGREASRVLLGLLVRTFPQDGPLVFDIDEASLAQPHCSR